MPSRLDSAGTPMWSNCTRRSYWRRRALLAGARDPDRLGLVLGELDLEPLDPRAVHLDHDEPQAVVLDLVPLLRRAPQRTEDEARDRVVVLLRQLLGELLVEVVDGERAVDEHATVLELLDGLVGEVVLVLDLADDLLEQV